MFDEFLNIYHLLKVGRVVTSRKSIIRNKNKECFLKGKCLNVVVHMRCPTILFVSLQVPKFFNIFSMFKRAENTRTDTSPLIWAQIFMSIYSKFAEHSKISTAHFSHRLRNFPFFWHPIRNFFGALSQCFGTRSTYNVCMYQCPKSRNLLIVTLSPSLPDPPRPPDMSAEYLPSLVTWYWRKMDAGSRQVLLPGGGVHRQIHHRTRWATPVVSD